MGSIEPGMATATLGTGGFTNLVVDTPTTALGGMLTNHHAVSGLWQVGRRVSGGGEFLSVVS